MKRLLKMRCKAFSSIIDDMIDFGSNDDSD
jgi:hypothetical protein